MQNLPWRRHRPLEQMPRGHLELAPAAGGLLSGKRCSQLGGKEKKKRLAHVSHAVSHVKSVLRWLRKEKEELKVWTSLGGIVACSCRHAHLFDFGNAHVRLHCFPRGPCQTHQRLPRKSCSRTWAKGHAFVKSFLRSPCKGVGNSPCEKGCAAD